MLLNTSYNRPFVDDWDSRGRAELSGSHRLSQRKCRECRCISAEQEYHANLFNYSVFGLNVLQLHALCKSAPEYRPCHFQIKEVKDFRRPRHPFNTLNREMNHTHECTIAERILATLAMGGGQLYPASCYSRRCIVFIGEQEPVDQTTSSLQLSNDSSVCGFDVTDASRQRVSPSSSSSSSSFCGLPLPVPDVTLCVTDCHRQTPPTTPLNTRQVSDECRRSTGSDHCVAE